MHTISMEKTVEPGSHRLDSSLQTHGSKDTLFNDFAWWVKRIKAEAFKLFDLLAPCSGCLAEQVGIQTSNPLGDWFLNQPWIWLSRCRIMKVFIKRRT